MATTNKAKQLVNNYITQRAIHKDSKLSRKELMLRAGYTTEVAKVKNPELNKLYAELSSDIINKVSFVLASYVDKVVECVNSGELDTQDISSLMKQLHSITNVFKGLTPTYKEKQVTKDIEGNYKTVWKQLN